MPRKLRHRWKMGDTQDKTVEPLPPLLQPPPSASAGNRTTPSTQKYPSVHTHCCCWRAFIDRESNKQPQPQRRQPTTNSYKVQMRRSKKRHTRTKQKANALAPFDRPSIPPAPYRKPAKPARENTTIPPLLPPLHAIDYWYQILQRKEKKNDRGPSIVPVCAL